MRRSIRIESLTQQLLKLFYPNGILFEVPKFSKLVRAKNKFAVLVLNVLIVVLIMGCNGKTNTNSKLGNWTKLGAFEGVARTQAVSAELNGKVYVGLGYNGIARLSDFWVYNPNLDFWLRKADFPGTPRSSAVSFSAGNMVYVGLGTDGVNIFKDFWAYDTLSNSWTQVASFEGSARYMSTAFSINDSGYVTGGYDGTKALKDLWMYDPSSNTWTQKAGFGGSKRSGSVVFVINNKAYLTTGFSNGSDTYVNDCWMYDPVVDTWTEKRKIINKYNSYDILYTTITRKNAVGFTINGKGYIATGINNSYITNVWEYDPSTDLWVEKTGFEGSPREGSIGMSVNGKGYVALGSSLTSAYFDDVRVFSPTDANIPFDDY